MEFSESLFEVLVRIIVEQNRVLLTDMALRLKIPIRDLFRDFIFTKDDIHRQVLELVKGQSSSSSSDP
jgi:hypothetical protein